MPSRGRPEIQQSQDCVFMNFMSLQNAHAQSCLAHEVNLSSFQKRYEERRADLAGRSTLRSQRLPPSALSHSAIKVRVSAIPACHEDFGERLVPNIPPS